MEAPQILDVAGVSSLLDRLEIEADEVAVFSFAALHEPDGPAHLAFASVLFGPPEIAAESWPRWSANASQSSAALVQQWEAGGVDTTAWTDFAEVRDGWLFGRRCIAAADGVAVTAAWLADLLAGDAVNIPGGPPIQAELRAAAGVTRTFPHLASPAGLLVGAVQRPTIGYFFPMIDPPNVADAPVAWDIGGYSVPAAPLWVLGLPITDPPLHSRPFDPESLPVPGVMVGRVERRAWISGLRGEPTGETYLIALGLDHQRVSLADLEVDLEEFHDGELISARRLRLGDLQLPPLPIPPTHVVELQMSSLGLRLSRQVRLYDRDGLLLDIGDRMPTIEAIQLVVQAGNAQPVETVIGGAPPTALLDRLARADQADAEYAQALQEGLAGRVIDDPAKGLPVLRDLLQGAHGDLAVLDPYFGWDVVDWSALGLATGGIRVLTGHGYYNGNGTLTQQKVKAPPAGTAPASASFSARSWRGGKPPWHDRVYLWQGGGLSVGTSPSGLGKRVARIDRMTANETAGWQNMFDTWWASADVATI